MAWAVPEAGALLPLLQGFPQHGAEEADEDMGVNGILALMPDWADCQVLFLDAEGRLGLGELDVGAPEVVRTPVGDVGAEDVAALAPPGPLVLVRPGRHVTRTRDGTLTRRLDDRVAARRAGVGGEQAAELALHGAARHGSARVGEPPRQPGQPGLDARLEAGVHGVLLLPTLDGADQDERLRPFGAGHRLASMPSRTVCQSWASASWGAQSPLSGCRRDSGGGLRATTRGSLRSSCHGP